MNDRAERIKELRGQANTTYAEIRRLENEEKDERNAWAVGKYFIYRNSAGGRERWNMYTRIEATKDGELVGTVFQSAPYGRIEVEVRSRIHDHLMEKEITKGDYDKAYTAILAKLAALALDPTDRLMIRQVKK